MFRFSGSRSVQSVCKRVIRTTRICHNNGHITLIQAQTGRLSSSASTSSTDKNPLRTIQGAIDSLDTFSSRLIQVSKLVDKQHVLISSSGLIENQEITLPQVILHSRDTDPEEFQRGTAIRDLVLETAKAADEELRDLAGAYGSIAQQMETATRICQETPCGGASWEMDLEALQKNPTKTVSDETGNQHVKLDGMDSPCGKLQLASFNFLKTTYETKPQVLMGSRALLILQLSIEFNLPLRSIKESGTKEQNQQIKETFETQVIQTPWLRTEKEYKQLLQVQEEMGIGRNA